MVLQYLTSRMLMYSTPHVDENVSRIISYNFKFNNPLDVNLGKLNEFN